MLTTLLLPTQTLENPILRNQVVSLLAGNWGNIVLQTEMAISASALLVFASNTAIIGSYHVFMALSRMEFFPAIILRRNRLRGTPHYSIALATGIPIVVLLIAGGSLDLLGNMYAFGLLGAFTLTCLGLDLVRYRERKAAQARLQAAVNTSNTSTNITTTGSSEKTLLDDPLERAEQSNPTSAQLSEAEEGSYVSSIGHLWSTINFWLGILTTVLVAVAWSTNLVAKPLATAFGGSVASVGMIVAYFNYARHKRQGRSPVGITHVEHRLPGSILAVLRPGDKHNETVIHAALNNTAKKPIVFLFIGEHQPSRPAPRMFEFADPYLHDQQAKDTFARAEHLAQKTKIPRRYVYRLDDPDAVGQIWPVF